MRICMFCKSPLDGVIGVKSNEHVLRKSWLDRLDHLKTITPSTHYSKKTIIDKRENVTAGSVLTGDVCAACNNGWMDRLDRSVEDLVFALAEHPGGGVSVSDTESFNLARWVLKTACTFVYTDNPSRRHIPQHILENMPDPNYLPSGFIAFSFRFLEPVRDVGLARLDVWPHPYYKEAELIIKSQTSRMKFAVQYNNVIIGCAFIENPAPKFFIHPNLHVPFYIKDTEYEYISLEDGGFNVNDLLATMTNSFLNLYLTVLGANIYK